MQSPYKGIISAYDNTLNSIETSKSFYEWMSNSSGYEAGQICEAPIWFVKKNKWYFKEGNYDPKDESNSTWRA